MLNRGCRLATGGQGDVFEVIGLGGVVLKRIFNKTLADDPEVYDRLVAMITNPPTGWRESRSGHVMLAWPTDVVLEDERFVGFLMPAIDVAQAVELHQIANPSDRRSPSQSIQWTKGFTWRYLVGTAENLALATNILHSSGVVIGDFNERNVLVWSDARVTLLDCDSMQVTDHQTGRRFLCRVGRPEFTAPELLGADWNTTVRAPSSDLFALAIHLHQLLLEGNHPFDGVWSGAGDKPRRHVLAREGLWVHRGDPRLAPRPGVIGIEILPEAMTNLFRRAFVDGAMNPRARPTAEEWHAELAILRTALVPCLREPSHIYAAGRNCPWCDHIRRKPAQTPLPRATPPALPTTPPRGPQRAPAAPVLPPRLSTPVLPPVMPPSSPTIGPKPPVGSTHRTWEIVKRIPGSIFISWLVSIPTSGVLYILAKNVGLNERGLVVIDAIAYAITLLVVLYKRISAI